MQIQGIDCPSCGAPVSVSEGNTKATCEYCGKNVLFESQMLQNIGDKVANTFQKVETQTQEEIRRLQLSQELSLLQMQLSNLRAEKRGLERTGGRQAMSHLKQIQDEERGIISKITTIQNLLNPPKPSSVPEKREAVKSKRNGVSSFFAWIIAWFFLSGLLAVISGSIGLNSVPIAEQEKWSDSYMPIIMIGSWIVAAIILISLSSKQEAKQGDRVHYKQGLSLMQKGLYDDAKVEFMRVIQSSSPDSKWYSSAQTRLMEMKMQGK